MINSATSIAHIVKCKPRTSDVAFDDSVTFESLRLNSLVLKGLKEAGFEKPSPIQLKSIPLGKCGFDLVVQAKSGTGKTCVFSVLILQNLITESDVLQALVLAPTREIAVQISDVIIKIGKFIPNLKCHTFIGGLSVEEDKKNLKKCHVAIATPGRMKHLMDQEETGFEHVRFLVLDEADRLLDSNFQDDIVWIYKHLPVSKQMITLSATYPESLAHHITKFMESAVVVRLNSEDPALLGVMQYYKTVPFSYISHQVYSSKFSELLKILNAVDYSQCLIFTNLQIRTESLQADLNREKFPTAFIAGNMSQEHRLEAISNWIKGKCRILVSTDLTSRGIDAKDVDLVVNFDVPSCHETYLHRIGRGGRFGSLSAAITLVAVGEEFDNLARIEQLSNTHIAQLPDPMPSDITRNRDVLMQTKIKSISSSRITLNAQDAISLSDSSINPCIEESKMPDLQKNDDDTEDGMKNIDCKALVSVLFGTFDKPKTNKMSASRLLEEYHSFRKPSDKDFLKIKTAVEASEESKNVSIKHNEQDCKNQIEIVSDHILSKVIDCSRSIYFKRDEEIFGLCMEHLASKIPQLEQVFNINCKDINVGPKNDAEADNIDSSSSLNSSIRYSKAQLLSIKKSMPDNCFDYSKINCDEKVLLEIKRGEYSRGVFNHNKTKFNKVDKHKTFAKNFSKSDEKSQQIVTDKPGSILGKKTEAAVMPDNVDSSSLSLCTEKIQQLLTNDKRLQEENIHRDCKDVEEKLSDSCVQGEEDSKLKSLGCDVHSSDRLAIPDHPPEQTHNENLDVNRDDQDQRESLHDIINAQDVVLSSEVQEHAKQNMCYVPADTSDESTRATTETCPDHHVNEKENVEGNVQSESDPMLTIPATATYENDASYSMLPPPSSSASSGELTFLRGSLDPENEEPSQKLELPHRFQSQDGGVEEPKHVGPSKASVTSSSKDTKVSRDCESHKMPCNDVTRNQRPWLPHGKEIQLLSERSWKIACLHASYIDHMIKFNKDVKSRLKF